MDQYYGEWVPYTENDAINLAIILLVVASIFTLAGSQLGKPLRVRQPGKAVTAVLVVVWILAILTFLVNLGVYAYFLQQAKFTGTVPENPITKFTLSFAFLSFLIIMFINRKRGTIVAFWSGILAAMAGPMIFELPFDLIVMSRTYPPIPPDPNLVRALFFLPLYLTEITTIALLFLSPLFRVTRYTLYALAGMFFVFAIWGYMSFSFPDTAEFLILNVVAKALAFVTVVTVFLPDKQTEQAKNPEVSR